MKNIGHLTPPLYQLELVSYGTTVNVSTLTTLLAFTDLGSENQSITIMLDNQDATNTVTLIVDVSHGGVHPNLDRRQQKTAQPQSEVSIELSAPMPYTYVRVSAQTASPAFPVVQVKYAIVVGQR